MMEKGQMAPKDYILEFIETLKIEIEELKNSKDNNILLTQGVLQTRKSSSYIYRFHTEQPFAHHDNTVYKLVADSSQFDCEYISSNNNQITLKTFHALPVDQEITLFLDRTTLPKKLLQCFQESLHSANQQYAMAARLFQGHFLTHTTSAPNLTGYSQVNAYQKAAVIRSFQGDTIIWGPPGTGKTHTIAIAIHEQLKQGHRVLLLSHANTAVDGAMEELADLLHNEPVYTEGHLVRMGASQLEKYPLLSLDEIIRVKENAIQNQIAALEADLKITKNKDSDYRKIDVLREAYQQKQHALSKKADLFRQQENQLRDYTLKHEQGESTLRFWRTELSRLERKKLQTRRTKEKIAWAQQQIHSFEHFLAENQSSMKDLRSNHSALALELSDLEKMAQADASAFRSALAATGLTEAALERELQRLSSKISKLEQQRNELKRQISTLRRQVVVEASVVGATLSMAYMSSDLQAKHYDALFIDEISMAPLLPVFFAMSLAKSSCTLIGDFLQLPPIGTQSKNYLVKKWENKSFFELIGLNSVYQAKNCEFVKPLSIQYRMNPAIASIPNQLLYGGILQSGDNTKARVLSDRWVQTQPLVLIDTSESDPWMNRGPKGKSRCNLPHASLAAAIAQDYLSHQGQGEKEITIGIVVPYLSQKELIRKILDAALGEDTPERRRIEVNTVHSFQGGEKDVIICDSVESEGMDTNWFFFDEGSRENQSAPLMLNVAVTRAKSKFILLANVSFIHQKFHGHIFKNLLELLRQQGAVLSASQLGIGFQTAEEECEIQKLQEIMSIEDLKQYDTNSFWGNIIPDLKHVHNRVIIFCPFVRKQRIDQLLPLFKKITESGNQVIIYTRPVSEHQDSYQTTARSLIDSLRKEGAVVRIRKNMHEKVILIDDTIVWQGSLNLLSHRNTKEQMQRIVSKSVQKEVEELLDLNQYKKITAANDPTMQCDLCKGLLVKRSGPNGEFYGCSSFPDCGFKKAL